ncbi:MAG: right-handed parallel beta-helix repeat-containing protein, partial [Planctomycetota bacterium]
VYLPDRNESEPLGSGDPTATFQLLDGVELLGGFAGVMPNPDARDIALYETILSGDLLGDDEPGFVNNADNAWHVVTGSGTDPTAVLEGFTITSGFANGTSYPDGTDGFGGGMLTIGGSPTVRSCTFRWNRAFDAGGGMANISGSSPVVTACVFEHNQDDDSETGGGGGIVNALGSEARILACSFSDNVGSMGGGVYNYQVDHVVVDGCTFESNVSRSDGGGLETIYSTAVTVTNCFFEGNEATWGAGVGCYDSGTMTMTNCRMIRNSAQHGGGVAIQLSAATIANCLFLGNTATTYGGGLHTWTGGHPTVVNSTFHGNTGADGAGVYNRDLHGIVMRNSIVWQNEGTEIGGLAALVAYSDIQGGYAGPGNWNSDPMFFDPGNDDCRLMSGSICIDAGHNWAVPQDVSDLDADGVTNELLPVDLAGDSRFNADELDFDPGCGIPVVVDLGAFEYQFDPVAQVMFADVDGDGTVTVADLVQVIMAWGTCDPGACCLADVDFSGQVDTVDLVHVILNWS